MVEVKHLCASYSDQEILHDISLSFLPGKVTVLAGPNGCGKSTLLRAILGFAEKTGGEITVDGRRMETFSQRELAQKIAYLPQSRPIPNISAYRMVLHGRAVCMARSPQCGLCTLASVCKYGKSVLK